MKSRLARKDRRGFTLVELLVVISIIAVLASLILPGVMAARRAARRTQCVNNMKNIGTAILNYVTTRKKFPASGTWDAGDPATITDANLYSGSTRWNFVTPPTTASTIGMKYSWAVEVLPYLERSDIFDAWDFKGTGLYGSYLQAAPVGSTNVQGNNVLSDTSIRIFTCPEDITTVQGHGNQSYVVNGGFSFHWLVTNDGAAQTVSSAGTASANNHMRNNLFNMGLMFLDTYQGTTSANRRHSLDTIRDGATTTIMLSENINTGYDTNTTPWVKNWACPHPYATSFFVNGIAVGNIGATSGIGSSIDYTKCNITGTVAPPLNAAGTEGGGLNSDTSGVNEGQFPYPNSLHGGGVHVTMCDGATRFLSQNIDANLWSRLVTPAGSRLVDANAATVQQNYTNWTQKVVAEDEL